MGDDPGGIKIKGCVLNSVFRKKLGFGDLEFAFCKTAIFLAWLTAQRDNLSYPNSQPNFFVHRIHTQSHLFIRFFSHLNHLVLAPSREAPILQLCVRNQ